MGFLIWLVSYFVTGHEEPWDAEGALILYYPVSLFVAGILSALPSPKKFLMGCIGIYLGQIAEIIIFHPSSAMWLIGAIYGLLFMVISFLGGALIWFIKVKHKKSN